MYDKKGEKYKYISLGEKYESCFISLGEKYIYEFEEKYVWLLRFVSYCFLFEFLYGDDLVEKWFLYAYIVFHILVNI